MKTKILFLDAVLILLVGFFLIYEPVLPSVLLNSRAGRSLEYFSASEKGAASPDKAYFVKAIYTEFPDAYAAAHSARPVVHPVSLERVAP